MSALTAAVTAAIIILAPLGATSADSAAPVTPIASFSISGAAGVGA